MSVVYKVADRALLLATGTVSTIRGVDVRPVSVIGGSSSPVT